MAYRVIFEVFDLVDGNIVKDHILDNVPSVDDVIKIAEHDFNGRLTGEIQSFRVLLRTFEYTEYLRPGDERDMMSLNCVRVRLERL